MNVHHIIIGARGDSRLVLDDIDRVGLLRLVRRHLRRPTLAYSLLDTHAHFVIEGDIEALRAAVEMAFRVYARTFNARHEDHVFLRGPVTAMPAPGQRELARMIRYVHENPIETKPPIVTNPVHFEWGSGRAFGGLARDALVDVRRARELIGPEHLWRIKLQAPPLADLEPVSVPSAPPELILAAVAQTFGLLQEELIGSRRLRVLTRARAVFARLGTLESYHAAQLAPVVDLTRQRIWQLTTSRVDERDARIARTLFRTEALRARLRPQANFAGRKLRAVHSA